MQLPKLSYVSSISAWTALIVSTVVLLSVLVYTHVGELTKDQKRDARNIPFTVTPMMQFSDESAARQLVVLKGRIRSHDATEKVADDIRQIRENLAETYISAHSTLTTRGQQLDQQLDQLEKKVRSDSTDALESLEETIEMLRQNTESAQKRHILNQEV